MPRLTVPVTRWTMNGTVSPRSVVVCWMSVAAGSYGTNWLAVLRYSSSTRVGALHCASVAAPSGGFEAFGLQA